MNEAALAVFIATKAEARNARIGKIWRLPGGAVKQSWAIDTEIEGGPMAGEHTLVLRAPGPSGLPSSIPLDQEFAIHRSAWQAGIPVPEPLWFGAEGLVMAPPFYLMHQCAGTAEPERILGYDAANIDHPSLALKLAASLAGIHTMRPSAVPRPALADDPALRFIQTCRDQLDQRPTAHPVLEWGLRYLERNRPQLPLWAFCHRDFRTGNYLVDEGGLVAILDWEFAGWSDPHEDIGWFCAKCWRFGAPGRAAGGLASHAVFFTGYEQAGGLPIDPDRVEFWEIAAHIRWAIIALQQSDRHASGAEPRLEFALLGRRLAELEHEILAMTGGT